jgi:hypothetical protein
LTAFQKSFTLKIVGALKKIEAEVERRRQGEEIADL